MMPRIHLKDKQTAQGIVEFALVLPLLLVIIFGIIAFGHLFFVYSSVVASSREAARYGAAVGISSNGKPRYLDCDAIRESAANIGRFAGVVADSTHVEVLYDSGPDDKSAPRLCTGTTSPESVKLGDRIIVRTKVTYKPIVPLVNIPSVPLNAETKRTLIKELPVGEVPTAESPCQTKTDLIPSPVTPVTGQLVSFEASLTKVKGYSFNPAGLLKLQIDPSDGVELVGCGSYVTTFEDGVGGVSFLNANPTFSTSCSVKFNHGGPKTIRVNYDASQVYKSCYPSTITEFAYTVDPADTKINFPSPPAYALIPYDQKQISVTVDVLALLPDGSPSNLSPAGTVLITDANRPNLKCTAQVIDNSASCVITVPGDDIYRFKAEYTPDNPIDFNPSSATASENFTFPPPVQATLTPKPPTATATEKTVVPPTPQKTPTPSWCPRVDGTMNFYQPTNGIYEFDYFTFWVTNPGTSPVNIKKISVQWPDSGSSPLLKDIRFGDVSTPCSNNKSDCMWQGTSGVSSLVVPSSGQAFTSDAQARFLDDSSKKNNVNSKEMRFMFARELPNSPTGVSDAYFVKIEFVENNCILEVTGTRKISH